jgi:hypothetical protein
MVQRVWRSRIAHIMATRKEGEREGRRGRVERGREEGREKDNEWMDE